MQPLAMALFIIHDFRIAKQKSWARSRNTNPTLMTYGNFGSDTHSTVDISHIKCRYLTYTRIFFVGQIVQWFGESKAARLAKGIPNHL